ncbi:MAG: sulfotransferase domain-containing protein [Pseudomonadota bacterium]|uniref:sulfotransferase domain-containing protein n=1 Tax=Roseovarius TaxID=74030 RepID=UPI0022A89166|nr:sulfotransferase domain-containing protein [Roseovarius sp. EGI FJ00037]MCZ0812896.1 sulfotransferase domain-containing protein [Roseovarius sp. EGI FJ00037]
MKKNIVWLASYPKSGNTWTRIFLANYLSNAETPVPINEVTRYGMGDAITKTYEMVARQKIDPRDIPLTLRLRDKVLRGISGNNADVNLVKTHNTCKAARGIELIPPRYTKSAIYIIRNPLDMVLSYARHYNLTPEQAAEAICHKDNALMPDATTVVSFLGTWSDHVRSWTRKHPFPVLVLRYEDILADPEAEFTKVIEHFGMNVDVERLRRAIRFASFKEVKKQEESSGFIERPAASESFFTKGGSGHWKDDLDPELAAQIRAANHATMKYHGYLDE